MKIMRADPSMAMLGGNREPHIQLNHVDGPLLIKSDGSFRWLNLRERFLLFFNLIDAAKLDAV